MTVLFNQTRRIYSAPLLLFMLLALSGCGLFDGTSGNFDSDTGEEIEREKVQSSPGMLIAEGMDAYNVGDYQKAIRAFEKILDEHPFSEQAPLAELKAADAHYYSKSYLEAKLLYLEFEERHPTNEAIPYVIFQIGMCDYARSDRIDRDITGAQDAIKTFSRLLRTYPQSPYTKEAKARIQSARNFLVNHEYFVAVFYVKTGKYDQATHRLKYILNVYPDSTIAPRAQALLERLEAGDPPKWGLKKWLPDLSMPDSWINSDDKK